MKEKQEESRSWPLTHSEVLRLLASAARGWRDDNALRLGAALSFYSLVSFPPLIIVTISIAALIFGREAAQAGLLRQVAQLLGKSGSEMFEQMMKAASRPGHGLDPVRPPLSQGGDDPQRPAPDRERTRL